MPNPVAMPTDMEITPAQAWKMLAEVGSARLVDVRTEPEWSYVGVPVLDELGKTVFNNSWHVFPEMKVNDGFVDELCRFVGPDNVLIFICRSGGRSLAAATASVRAGFQICYSIAGGFEGGLDVRGHRGALGGWKFEGLPWKQS